MRPVRDVAAPGRLLLRSLPASGATLRGDAMSFLRSFVDAPKAATPGQEAVPGYLRRLEWSVEQYSAARSLGHPEPLQIVERVDGIMQSVSYVRTEAAGEWQRDLNCVSADPPRSGARDGRGRIVATVKRHEVADPGALARAWLARA